METLQNNFTTPEQSNRLLELGVPADSADCSIDEWGRVHKIPQDNGNLLFSQLKRQTLYTIRPCWSVGRLIEIYKICNPDDSLLEAVHLGLNFDLITILMTSFEAAVGVGCMDFSKLED